MSWLGEAEYNPWGAEDGDSEPKDHQKVKEPSNETFAVANYDIPVFSRESLVDNAGGTTPYGDQDGASLQGGQDATWHDVYDSMGTDEPVTQSVEGPGSLNYQSPLHESDKLHSPNPGRVAKSPVEASDLTWEGRMEGLSLKDTETDVPEHKEQNAHFEAGEKLQLPDLRELEDPASKPISNMAVFGTDDVTYGANLAEVELEPSQNNVWVDKTTISSNNANESRPFDSAMLEDKVRESSFSPAKVDARAGNSDSLLSIVDLDALESHSFAKKSVQRVDTTKKTRTTEEFDPFSSGSQPTNLMKSQQRKPSIFTSEVDEALDSAANLARKDLNAVFVVRFDTVKGNMIEFQYPKELSLSGIEFTTLPSGSHSIGTDVIYFRRPPYFGLSVFKRTVVLSDTGTTAEAKVTSASNRGKSEQIAREERGARVRSLGILTKSFHDLHRHVSFLQQQVEMHIFADIGTLSDSLLAYYHIVNDGGSLPPMLLPSQAKQAAIENPLAYLPQFVHKYGPAVFTLWKMALLKQRLLFFSPPPVQESCLDVYCTSLLTNHDVPYFQQQGFEPLFYVNINDMALLEEFKVKPNSENPFKLLNSGYVSCTSDALFKIKTDLWDGLIYDGKVRLPPELNPSRIEDMRFGKDSARRYGAYRVNAADQSKYTFLKALINKHTARADSTMVGSKTGISGWISNLRGTVNHQSVSRQMQKEEETSSLLMDTDDVVGEKWNFARSNNQPTLSPVETDLATGAQESVTFRASLAILSYFHHLTTKLLSTILMLCHSPGEAVLYSWDLYNLDLDPYSGGDRQFLLDLAELYKLEIRIPLLDEERQLIDEGRLQDGWETIGNEDHSHGTAAAVTANGVRGTKNGGIYGKGYAGRWVGRNMTVMMREWEGFVGPQGLGIGAPGLGIGAVGLAAVGTVINAFKAGPPPS